MRTARTVATACLAAALAGCALFLPSRVQPGQDEAAVRAALGEPTGRYPLADGGRRLEYARGPFGLETWMVDVDAGGRVRAVVQVLHADNFAQVTPGMTRDDVLRLLGRPGFRQREFRDRETWSWRYDNPQCLWARLTFDAAGRTVEGVTTPGDPRCEPNDRTPNP